MRKVFFSLLGIAAFVVMALMPATSFAATSTRAAKPHPIHFFPHVGQTHKSVSASSNIPYNGGPVMTGTTNVYAILWEPTGNVSANYNSLIEQYFGDVGGSPLYKINTQYTQTGGAFPTNAVLKGSWVDTAAYPNPNGPLLDSDIQNEVTYAQSVNGWSSGSDNVFFVFTEKNENICTDNTQTFCATNTFCAYHSYFGNNTIYAAMPYAASFNCNPGASPNNDDADQTINVTSHEQMEAATDPFINAWIDYANPDGGEIGDLCAWQFGPVNSQGADVVWNNHGYIVQKEWSNKLSGCTLNIPPPPSIYNKMINRNSGLAMDVSGASKKAGAHVIQWPYRSAFNQQWDWVPIDNFGKYFQLVNRNSGLVLDVAGGSKSAGAQVIQWTNHHGLNQEWSIVLVGSSSHASSSNSGAGGYVYIVNRNSGLVLDVFRASKSAGATIVQWSNHHGLNQQWDLLQV